MILVLSRGVDSAINLLEDSGKTVIPPKLKYLGIFILCNLFLQGCMGM